MELRAPRERAAPGAHPVVQYGRGILCANDRDAGVSGVGGNGASDIGPVGLIRPIMYRRPKFLEVLHTIREEMSREADYDVDLFAEMVRSGTQPSHGPQRVIRGFRTRAPRAESSNGKPAKHRQRKRSA